MSLRVSVCIPTYNQCQYVALAVESAVNQTLEPYEIIVFDDFSTDKTPEVLLKLADKYPLLKIETQASNIGIAGNTDNCLRAASGDFVIRLDSDDILGNDFIKKLGLLLSLAPDAAYAHAAVQEIDETGGFTRVRRLMRKHKFQSGQSALRASAKGYRVSANIIMFRRSHLEKANYLTGRPDYVEDYHLSAELASLGFGNVYSEEILSFYRVWSDPKKTRKRRKLLEIDGLTKVFNDLLEPAWRKRQWPLYSLSCYRNALARRQANCLAWDVYTFAEKQELARAILNLSSAPATRVCVKLNLCGFSGLYNFIFAMKAIPKTFIKKVILAARSLFIA